MLLIHEPYDSALEMYEAMKEAYRAGKVRAIGISKFNEKKYQAFAAACDIVPAVSQVESHVYYPQLALQKEMETILSSLDGVGRLSLMLTVEGGGVYELAQDESASLKSCGEEASRSTNTFC